MSESASKGLDGLKLESRFSAGSGSKTGFTNRPTYLEGLRLCAYFYTAMHKCKVSVWIVLAKLYIHGHKSVHHTRNCRLTTL